MNYILKQLDRKINFLASDNKKGELRILYQSKFEFLLIFSLSYLWNKNWKRLSINDREYVINCINKPSIGTIVSIIQKLDIDNEIFKNRRLKSISSFFSLYPKFRNEKIGHGYSYSDDLDSYLEFFENFFEELNSSELPEIFQECDLVYIDRLEEDIYKGICYKPDGSTYLAWSCNKNTFDFDKKGVYALSSDNNYFKLSPFVLIENETDFFTFCSIEEKLTGRTKFNQLLKTGYKSVEIKELENIVITTDKLKRKTSNGTIVNIYENNFKKYIDTGIPKSIINFLTKNRSSVFATIWGHGGVGKTASVQRCIEIISNQKEKILDYVIFLSAKDRYYNYYQGKINPLKSGISSLDDIVSNVNEIISGYPSYEIEKIINYSGKLLLVIDDFETFSKVEKERITNFIKKLDINHHKVILTTRAATLITGEEIQSKELSEVDTVNFLLKAIEIEIPDFNIASLKKELRSKENKSKVFEITTGRPLFVFQLANFIAQKGNLAGAINHEITSTKEAINFLYDRIYEYLSLSAKNMFLAISLLVNENDLTGLIENLKFILNKEDKQDEFQESLNELAKLKIIVINNDGFFKVYSVEILKLMKLYYQNKGSEYDGSITTRFNLINTENGHSTEVALLENANASRLMEREVEVENKYRYILNRTKTPYDIKLEALFNYSSYLISHRNKPEKALKLFQDYSHYFKKNHKYIINYSSTAWAEGTVESRYNAVKIIQDYLASSGRLLNEDYLELLGSLMTYKAIIAVNERDDLKGKKRRGEINSNEYNALHKEQKERFFSMFNFPGRRLFSLTKKKDLMLLSPSVRNVVLDGLTHFIEICIRCNKRDLGREVCDKVLAELPQSYQTPFVYKLNKINYIENPDSFNNNNLNIMPNSQESDLAIKLKKALNSEEE